MVTTCLPKNLSDVKNEDLIGPEPTWSITKEYLVKIRKFQGETYVDIREYYMDKLSWEVKPGACLTTFQNTRRHG